jgi:hypothetical protein
MAILKQHRNDIVSIGKDIGFNHDVFAYRAFNGESASIDFWTDSFDDDPLPSKLVLHGVRTFSI